MSHLSSFQRVLHLKRVKTVQPRSIIEKPWILVNTHLLTRERTLNQEHKSDYSVSLHFKPSNFLQVTNSLASAYRSTRNHHVSTGKTDDSLTTLGRQGLSSGQEMNRKWPLTVDQEIHHRISDWSWDEFEHLISVSNQAQFLRVGLTLKM